MALIAYALASAISSHPAGGLKNLIDLPALVLNDRDRSKLLRNLKPVSIVVDHEHLACSLNHGGMRGHQSNGPRAVDHNRIAGTKFGQTCRMPTRREDIRQDDVVALFLF